MLVPIPFILILSELKFSLDSPTKLHVDNSAAMATATKPGFTQRSKSMRLLTAKSHNVRQRVQDTQDNGTCKRVKAQINPWSSQRRHKTTTTTTSKHKKTKNNNKTKKKKKIKRALCAT